ncbi:glycosyltransferase family 4 protein [Cognatilysobacter bugurensis]|uniref:Glycosyl transferase n=1 Tax=Cognatilysobacter bugurensis TaxID=543356 RepID=A0A918SSP1_9GAMM|nr:glycosyltransferase family 1 protein [Lysobacter bugurensis]GHA69526.1 glycosyl transferase [Lysobacter bugurensis]
MQYAIVTETYPPEVNGVALTVQSMECGLRARGHQVSVVRPHRSDRAAPHELLVPGAPLPRYAGLQFGLPATTRLVRHWRTHRPDGLYVATEGPLGWSAVRAARRLGIPVATGFHTRFDRYLRDYGLGALEPLALAWLRRFHSRGDATFVPTRELQQRLQAQRFDRVVHLPRTVDTARFSPARRDAALRARWGASDDTLVVLHVGRLAPEKNVGLAIAAFRCIQRLRADTRLVIVGDGPSRPALERAHPDLTFCGLQRDGALARHYASGDLLLFPSRSESFGNVTLEAMASGVPTVAFDTAAAREHLRGSGGGAATGPTDEEFIDAAVRIAADDVLCRAMAGAARQAVLHLHPAQLASDLDRLLQGLVDRRAGRLRAAGEPRPAPALYEGSAR